MANGQEFKGFIKGMKKKPDIICIQETWLKPALEFCIKGYDSIRRDREDSSGGGCIIFIKQGIHHKILGKGVRLEYLIIEVGAGEGNIKIVNFYNPCKKLSVELMEEITGKIGGKVIWGGDFNAQSTLWGNSNNNNGMVIEEIMDNNNLVCLNDGSGTRYNSRTGTESAIDLTLVSDTLAGVCTWEVIRDTTVGSDHYPIKIEVGVSLEEYGTGGVWKWNFNNADWEKFRNISEQEMGKIDINEGVEKLNEAICKAILEAANKSIQKKGGRAGRKIVPWWTKACDKAIKDRNKAFKHLKRNHNFQNLIEYKRLQANARRVIKNAKKDYWRKFCNSVGRETGIDKIWGMIKRMNGIKREYGYPVLNDGETTAVRDEQKAEMLVKAFVNIHSSDNISEEGKRGKEATEVENEELFQHEEEMDDLINKLFTKTELNRSLKKTKVSAPGKDEMCYVMINKLSDASKDILMELYNKVWESGKLPQSWKEVVVIPIRKPGKDSTKPGNYRPIALISNICKIMEKMINERLIYYMENKGYISKYQSGFRRGRNTMDPVLCLEHEIRKAQINKESVVAVFFDIEKAYDMMWGKGLLIRLCKVGIKGRMFRWIKDFLLGRVIQVRIGNKYSGNYEIENGTPQGSIISPLLFSLMINEVFNEVENGVGLSLFADDGAMWKRGRNVKFIVKKLQEAITKVEEWSYKWGFKFSVDKTKTVFFTRKRIGKEIKLKLYNQELERVKQFKFLGVWFDDRITWAIHIQKVVDKCKKVLNIMRCLVGREWGADRTALKAIYTGLIRAILDYGCVVYGSAASTSLKKLEVIQSQALRICSGAFKTTPNAALLVEMGEMPLEMRRTQLAINYWANLKGHGLEHPTQDTLKPSYEKESRETKSFGWIATRKATDLGVAGLEICPTVPMPVIPPWIIPEATVDLTWLERKLNDSEFIMNAHTVQTYIDRYHSYVQIYTDASKRVENKIGVAFSIPEFHYEVGKRISDDLSVYTGEMVAILLAVQWIEEIQPLRTIICSDSSSSLASIKDGHSVSRPDILIEIQQTLYRIQMMGLTVVFLWVPAHIGIKGNERADKKAKEGSKNCNIDIKVGFSKSEVKSLIKLRLRERWQKQWEEERKGRWFFRIQRKVGEMRGAERNRKEETIITRLRFGHTGLNGSLFKIGKHETGRCEYCGQEETVKHVIINCQRFEEERRLLIQNLRDIETDFDLIAILKRNSRHACYQILLQYLRRTKTIERI